MTVENDESTASEELENTAGHESEEAADAAAAASDESTATGGEADDKGKAGASGDDSETLLSGDEGDGSGGDDGDSEGEGAGLKPEEYKFEPPEGIDLSEGAQKRVEDFAKTASELGLSQDQFQRMMEMGLQRAQEREEALSSAYHQRIEEWRGQVQQDKELGGEHLDENVAVAKTALKQFGSEDLGKLIDAPGPNNPDGLGLGNHPAFMRFAVRVGKALSDGELITGDSASTGGDNEQEALRRFYPSMFPNE